jgi:hypothetical protein
LLLLPLMAGIMVASVLSGQVTARTGRYKIFPVIGTAAMTAALLLLSARLGVDTPLWEADVYMALFGFGLGFCLQTLIMAVQNAVPARDMGVATASATFFRQMGGTLGVAVFLSILFSVVGTKITEAFRTVAPTPEFRAALADPAIRANPANRMVVETIGNGGVGGNGGLNGNAGGVLQDSSFLREIDPRLARPFLVGFSEAMDLVFLIAAGVMFLAFVLMLFLEEVPLRTQSGIEARAAELAAETGAAPTSTAAAAESVPRTAAPIGPAAGPLFPSDGSSPGTNGGAISAAWWRRRRGSKPEPGSTAPDSAGSPTPTAGEPEPAPELAVLRRRWLRRVRTSRPGRGFSGGSPSAGTVRWWGLR